MPIKQLRLSMFDQDVCIQTDSVAYLDLLQKTYRHFVAGVPSPEEKIPFNVSFYLGKAGSIGKPTFAINGIERQLKDPNLLRSEYIHALIFSSLYSNVYSHFLHHAAALSNDNKGIILTADSGFGKTTLTLALVQKGFRFLSDEIAALGRVDSLLYPYPRGLHIRKETLELLKIPIPVEKTSHWFGKYLIDIDEIFTGMIGAPVNISYIFILKDEVNHQTSSMKYREFKAVISHRSPLFLQQIRNNPDVINVWETLEQGYPCLVVETAQRMKVIAFFEDLCDQHDVMILDLVKREEEIPEFAQAVQCQKIPRSQAAFELMRRFLGGHKTSLLDSGSDQTSTKLLFELSTLIKNADCYQLTIGPLQEMVEAISNIVCSDKAVIYSENKVNVL